MIEVNLLPGGKKRSAGGGFSLGASFDGIKKLLSRGSGGSDIDPYMGGAIAVAAIAVVVMGFTFLRASSTLSELEVQVEEALADSTRMASQIAQLAALRARGDSIRERIEIIQEIDAGRFAWPHILDEIAAAVPDFTWLREVQHAGDSPMQVRVTGRAGSIYAVTNFMRRLEGSRFLRGVTAGPMQQMAAEENPEDLVYRFDLTLTYESPGLDELETVPLFDEAAPAEASTEGGS